MNDPLFSDAQLLPCGAALVTEAGGDADAVLWITDDLGETLRPLLHRQLFSQPVRLYGVWFLDRQRGFACGEDDEGNGLLLFTADGGLSWTRGEDLSRQARDTPLTQVVFGDDRIGYAIGAGERMWRTADGGGTWRPVRAPGLAPFGVFLLDGRLGWALSQTLDGEFRIVRTQHYLTRDGGLSFEPLGDALEGAPLCADVSACGFWDDRRGALCGPEGVLLVTDDGGRTWRRVALQPRADLNFLAVLPGTTGGFAFGAEGLGLRTDDCGETWRELTTGTGDEIHAAAFADLERGFVVGEDGLLRTTRDGGRHFAPGRRRLLLGLPGHRSGLLEDR